MSTIGLPPLPQHLLLLPGSQWMLGLANDSSQKTSSLHVSSTVLMQALLSLLCLASLYLAVRTALRYHSYLDDYSSPVSEAPTMYLVTWLAACDIVTSISLLVLPAFDDIGGRVGAYIGTLGRSALAAQMCYFFLYALLSVHLLSLSNVAGSYIDSLASEYYGPAAATLAFALTYKLVTALPGYACAFSTILPLSALAITTVTAACVQRASEKERTRLILVHVEDRDSLTVRVDLGNCARFSWALAGLGLLFHLPWILWSNSWMQSSWVAALAYVCICARGLHPFALMHMSPALTMRVVGESGGGHEHQE
ncbi:hypothetical protein GGI07_005052 [Coemansia sp. Benny D115]|nr:hypothetical protein GGI07_005052 [Coemansia sp. Benny D115]